MENKLDQFNDGDQKLMKFLNTDRALGLLQEASVISCWDFNTSIGDTVRDKYDSLFIKIVEVTSVLLRNGATGFFWLVMSPEVFSIMDAATSDKYISHDIKQEIMGLEEGKLTDMGIMSRRWRIMVSPEWPANNILIGCGNRKNMSHHYARLSIANFVI